MNFSLKELSNFALTARARKGQCGLEVQSGRGSEAEITQESAREKEFFFPEVEKRADDPLLGVQRWAATRIELENVVAQMGDLLFPHHVPQRVLELGELNEQVVLGVHTLRRHWALEIK